MSDSDTTQSDTTGVVRLNHSEWYERQELADRLNVSLRTIDRRVKRGEVEKRRTPNGKVYRPTNDSKATQSDTVSDTNDTQSDSDRATHSDTTDAPMVSLPLSAWNDLLDRLDAKNERIDEFASKAGELQRVDEQLDRERSRADTLADELADLRQQFRSAIARLHVEKGRREMADDRADKLADDLEDVRRELQDTREADEDTSRQSSVLGNFFNR